MNNRKRNREKNIYKYLITLVITIVIGIVGYYCPELINTQKTNEIVNNDVKNVNTSELKDIPQYTDFPYVYINNNVPNFLESEYITKPFEIREVLARVQVQLRRKEEKETGIERDLSFKDMVLNRDTFQVRIDGRILSKITKQEFAILELLLRNPKQVFSKEDIFEYAWDEPYMGETKTLDVHISNIRKKIKQVTSDEYIETVWGIGYRLHA